MAKTLCDLTKLIKNDQARFEEMLVGPTHLCTKCGRVANDKKRLCKPTRLKNDGLNQKPESD